MKKISLRLDAEVHKRIKQIAQTENKSMNAVMVKMLENELLLTVSKSQDY